MELSLQNLRDSVEASKEPADDERAELFRRIRRGERRAEERLARLYSDGIRFYLRRKVGKQDLEERTRYLLDRLIMRIREGWRPEEDGLSPFLAQATRSWQPERRLPLGAPASWSAHNRIHEKVAALRPALRNCTRRELEILIRYYVNGQDLEQAVAEMRITKDELRLLKWRLRRLVEKQASGFAPLWRAASAASGS